MDGQQGGLPKSCMLRKMTMGVAQVIKRRTMQQDVLLVFCGHCWTAEAACPLVSGCVVALVYAMVKSHMACRWPSCRLTLPQTAAEGILRWGQCLSCYGAASPAGIAAVQASTRMYWALRSLPPAELGPVDVANIETF